MNKKLLMMSLLLSGSAWAQNDAEVSFKTTEVSKGIYMLQGEGGFTGGNLGLLVGEDGVVLIDDSMPPYLDLMNQAIEKGVSGMDHVGVAEMDH